MSEIDRIAPSRRAALRVERPVTATRPEVFGAISRVTIGEVCAVLGRNRLARPIARRVPAQDRPTYSAALQHGATLCAAIPLREVIVKGPLGAVAALELDDDTLSLELRLPRALRPAGRLARPIAAAWLEAVSARRPARAIRS